MSVMLCSRCQRAFHEGDRVMFRAVSIYHELPRPGMENFHYAVERPHAVTNIQHLCCDLDD